MKAVALGRVLFLGGSLGVFGLVGLIGCGVATSDLAGPGQVTGAAITGSVHGGQQPVVGSQVYVLGAPAVGSGNGYGQLASSLMNPSVTTSGVDGLPYVTTNQAGNFSITSDYNCTAGEPVYLLALGGDPGVGSSNSALALMAALGPCPGSGTFSSSSFVEINEVTTVAAVYALSGFLTGPENLSYPAESLATTGITNAINNAGQLADVSMGTALTTTPSGGAVPTATINTLANIIASCVNTDGSLTQTINNVTSNTNCGNLFEYTTVGSNVPTETVTALLNIAHNPATNVMELYELASKTSPFAGLSTQPNDFTLSIGYSPALSGLTATGSAGVPAVDASGNVWFPALATITVANEPQYYAVVEGLSPLGEAIGTSLIGETSPSEGTIPTPTQSAVDPSGNIWTALNGAGTVYSYNPSTTATNANFYNGFGNNDDGHQLAIDASGNVYIDDFTQRFIFKLSNTGTGESFSENLGPFVGVGITNSGFIVATVESAPDTIREMNSNGAAANPSSNSDLGTPIGALTPIGTPNSFAADSQLNVWATDPSDQLLITYNEKTVNKSTNTQYYSGGGLQGNLAAWPLMWVATDGGGNVWVANYGSNTIAGNISEFSNSGTAISPATGYLAQTACAAQGLAIDGSGDVWVGCAGPTPVLEYIGAAVPVYTPLTPGKMGIMP